MLEWECLQDPRESGTYVGHIASALNFCLVSYEDLMSSPVTAGHKCVVQGCHEHPGPTSSQPTELKSAQMNITSATAGDLQAGGFFSSVLFCRTPLESSLYEQKTTDHRRTASDGRCWISHQQGEAEKQKQHQLGLVLNNSQTGFSHLYVMTEWAVTERQTPFLYNTTHRADQSETVTVCSPLHIEKDSEHGNASCLF